VGRAAALIAVSLAVAGCGSKAPAAPMDLAVAADLAVSGDDLSIPTPTGDLELRITAYDPVAHTTTPVADGDTVGLILAPQGGHYLFLAFEARNVVDPQVAAVVDVYDGSTLIATSAQYPKLQPSASDPGLYLPDLSSYTSIWNANLCPDSSPDKDRFDVPYTLVGKLTENSTHRMATVTLTVTPTCPVLDDMGAHTQCVCECTKGWMPGLCPTTH
jgi:hypothetical protein